MDDLDLIAASLRRQKQDLEDSLQDSTHRHGEASEVLRKLEELRARAEETQRRRAELDEP